jgi:hypothetical protein
MSDTYIPQVNGVTTVVHRIARELSRHGIPADVVTAELPLASLPVGWALDGALAAAALL